MTIYKDKIFIGMDKPAILLGNGLNLFANGKRKNPFPYRYADWGGILFELSNVLSEIKLNEDDLKKFIKEGQITFPEIYTALLFHLKKSKKENFETIIMQLRDLDGVDGIVRDTNKYKREDRKMKELISKLIFRWEPVGGVHNAFADFMKSYRGNGIPILTTNFDNLLEQSINSETKKQKVSLMQISGGNEKAIKYYFTKYHSLAPLNPDSIDSHFAIWHIHGEIEKPHAILISSSDYAGFIKNLKTSNISESIGWLKIFYENDLVILGLGLGISEYPLRWLLSERMARFLGGRDKPKTIYCDVQKVIGGKRFFFDSIGVEIRDDFKNYDELYSHFGV